MIEQMEILYLHQQLEKANAEIMTLKDRLELAEVKRDFYQEQSQQAYKKLGEAEYGPLMQRIADLEAQSIKYQDRICDLEALAEPEWEDQQKRIADLEEELRKYAAKPTGNTPST